MQLPRGTFLSIKRSTKVGDLLAGLQEMKFNGVCTISSKSGNGTVVFKYGKRFLAEYQDTNGEPAWDKLLKISAEKVDASLSTLNEAQLQLSLEFNKTALIVPGAKAEKTAFLETPEPLHRTRPPEPPNPPVQPPPGPKTNLQKPAILKIIPSITSGSGAPVHAPAPPKIISDSQFRTATQIAAVQLNTQIHAQKPEGNRPGDLPPDQDDTGSSSFEEDIETFETMDVESIRDKIRGECRTLIRELNLEHLTEDDKGTVQR